MALTLYFGALLLIGAVSYVIERTFAVRWPVWLIPAVIVLLGWVLLFIGSTEPVDFGPVLFGMFVLWPVAIAIFLGGLFGRGMKDREHRD